MSMFGCQNKSELTNDGVGNVAIEEEVNASTETETGSTETVPELENQREETQDTLYTCDNSKINELAKQVIVLDENEEIEDQSWVAFNFCYRVSVGYVEPPKDTYKHKKDYFLFTGSVIPYFEVEYAMDNEDPGKRCVYDACDFHVVQEDVTFDGYEDLLISLGHAGAQGAEVYCAYVFDGEKEEYVYAPSFEEICNYRVDQYRHEISSYSRSNAFNDNNAGYWYFKPENSFRKISEYYGKEVSFEGGSNEFTEAIDTENDLYSLVVDLDRDGVDEAIVCEAYKWEGDNSELYRTNPEGYYYTEKIYFVDETKTPHLLEEMTDTQLLEGEPTTYLLKHQYLLIRDEEAYITLNGEMGTMNTGAIFTVENDKVVNITQELPLWGNKYFSGYDEIVWQKEDALTAYRITEGKSFLATGGTGICKLPYHYKLAGTKISGYQSKVVSIEEVQAMAPFDNTKFEEADAVEYIYRENGELYVNWANMGSEANELVHFEVETYQLTDGLWVFARRDNGYYNEDPLRAPKWDILTRVN